MSLVSHQRGGKEGVYILVQACLCFLSLLSHHLSPFVKGDNATELCSYLVLFGCVFTGAN